MKAQKELVKAEKAKVKALKAELKSSKNSASPNIDPTAKPTPPAETATDAKFVKLMEMTESLVEEVQLLKQGTGGESLLGCRCQSGIFLAFLGSNPEFDPAWGPFSPRQWFLGADRKYAPF